MQLGTISLDDDDLNYKISSLYLSGLLMGLAAIPATLRLLIWLTLLYPLGMQGSGWREPASQQLTCDAAVLIITPPVTD